MNKLSTVKQLGEDIYNETLPRFKKKFISCGELENINFQPKIEWVDGLVFSIALNESILFSIPSNIKYYIENDKISDTEYEILKKEWIEKAKQAIEKHFNKINWK